VGTAIPSGSRCTSTGTGYRPTLHAEAVSPAPASPPGEEDDPWIPQGILPFFVWKELCEVRRMNKMSVHLNCSKKKKRERKWTEDKDNDLYFA
jgi:hypothetical protein